MRPHFDGAPQKKVNKADDDDKNKKADSKNGHTRINVVFKNSGEDKRFDETTEVFYNNKISYGKLRKYRNAVLLGS